MAISFELDAKLRSDVGKGASRRLRRKQNVIPAIVYGAGVAPLMVTVDHNKMLHALENEAFYSHILTINVEKKSEKVVLKALQRHPFKKVILHADFLRVRADEKLHMRVPLHFTGEDVAPGIKLQGGKAVHYMTEIEVRCLPADLPEFIVVDISALNLNDLIYTRDLKISDKVELVALLHDEQANPLVVGVQKLYIKEEPETVDTQPKETEIIKERKETTE